MPSFVQSDEGLQQSPHPEIIRCPHCGADRNSRGKPFNRSSLSLHICKSHSPGDDTEVKPDNALTCGICGAWKSRKGTPFYTEADLSRHRSVVHRDSHADSAHAVRASTGVPVQSRSKESKSTARLPVNFCPQCGCNVEVVAAALTLLQ